MCYVQKRPCQYFVSAIAQRIAVPCCGCKFDKHVTFLWTLFMVNLAV